MTRLFFAVVGEKRVVGFVDIDEDAPTHSVRVAVKATQQYSFPATELTLFTTKRNRSAKSQWLASSSADLEALQTTPMPVDVKQMYLDRQYKLDPASLVSDYYADAPRAKVIHVLVRLPDQLHSPRRKKRALEASDVASPTPARSRQSLPGDSLPVWTDQHGRILRHGDAWRTFVALRFAVDWTRAPQDCPQLQLSSFGSFLHIPQHYLDGSGVRLPVVEQHATLYLRQAVAHEWDAIREWSIELPSRLWIIGGPGAGKSCAAFAFACSLDRAKWDVVWMHLDHDKGFVLCIRLDGHEKSTFEFHTSEAEQAVHALMAPWSLPSSKPLVVFYDGYHKVLPHCETIRKLLLHWQTDGPRKRRLVCVTSMASRGKDYNPSPMPVVRAENGTVVKVEKQLTLPSWTLDEYHGAVNDPAFFSAVYSMLEHKPTGPADLTALVPGPPPDQTPQELVRQKFYITGGNARAMFDDSTCDAIAHLTATAEAVDGVQGLRGTITDASLIITNRLRGLYGKGPFLQCGIVSPLALRLLAAKTAPDKIMKLPSPIRTNPGLDAFTLEAFVLASVTAGDFAYQIRTEPSAIASRVWPQADVWFFDPEAHYSKLKLAVGWNVPTKWDQSGYDAVAKEVLLVNASRREVRLVFLRTTSFKQHAFQANAFRELLQKVLLTSPQERVVKVDLCFVVSLDELTQFEAPVSTRDFKSEVVVAYPADQLGFASAASKNSTRSREEQTGASRPAEQVWSDQTKEARRNPRRIPGRPLPSARSVRAVG